MSRDRHDEPTAEELLAALAAGSDEPAARALAERDPDARAELDALRALINDVRAQQPRPAREPAWNDMARAIETACEQLPAPPAPWWARWRRALSGPRALLGVTVIGAAAVLLVILRPPATPAPTAGAPAASPVVDAPALAGDYTRPARIGELSGGELEALAAELDDMSALGELAAPGAGESDAADELGATVVEALVGDDEPTYLAGPGPTVFGEPRYDALLDDLDETELDALVELLERT